MSSALQITDRDNTALMIINSDNGDGGGNPDGVATAAVFSPFPNSLTKN